MELFKYTRREHFDSLSNSGAIRIGTLFDFRNTDRYGNQVGDQREGHAKFGGNFLNIRPGNNLVSHHPALQGLVKIGEGVHIENLVLNDINVQSENLYIFSTVGSFTEEAMRRWHSDPSARYNCCYRILSARLFFREISSHLRETADFLGFGEVHYYDDTKQIDLHSQISHLHPAQLKGGVNYDHQAEIRAFWRPRSRSPIEPLVISPTGLRRYVCQHFVVGAK